MSWLITFGELNLKKIIKKPISLKIKDISIRGESRKEAHYVNSMYKTYRGPCKEILETGMQKQLLKFKHDRKPVMLTFGATFKHSNILAIT